MLLELHTRVALREVIQHLVVCGKLDAVISAIPGKIVCLVAPKYFVVPVPGATFRVLSNGATHVCLRPIVAEILKILGGIPSVRIGSATSRPILTKMVLFERP